MDTIKLVTGEIVEAEFVEKSFMTSGEAGILEIIENSDHYRYTDESGRTWAVMLNAVVSIVVSPTEG